ncbi:pyrroline-5-carboxylate reductase [Desulfosarcina sp. OttesenSCG-928-A07]|nr:pyrroline-5-carboxylate reductase [Desulfosarcina sp. OttesenSCG-928-G17]MDL2328867.1 pyrroline-5-carboxylate reductase [Desulfosarcina sp. OttesenSCG-928-A07]
MLREKKIGIIGAGNMGGALINGLIHYSGVPKKNIICADASDAQLSGIREKFGISTTRQNADAVRDADIIIYAVKPQILAGVLRETQGLLDMEKLVISVAAGISIAAMEQVLGKARRIIRVMPNVAVSVREGATAISPGGNATEMDIDLARTIFDSLGKTVVVTEGPMMDAVTGLSGSGPAYVFLMAEALSDAGVKTGLSRKDAQLLAAQTLLGAARMLVETGDHPAVLKDQVTSPGGTTIFGLHALEQGRFRAAVINAVETAARRSKELGEAVMGQFSEGGTP